LRSRPPAALNWALVAAVFGLGAGLLLVGLGAEDLNGDECNALWLVKNGLWSYLRQFPYGSLLKLQFWLCDRLFRGALWGYRLPGTLAGIATIGVLMWLAWRFWPKRRALPVCVGLLAAFGTQHTRLCRWGMANYGEYVLVAALVLGLFLHLLQGPLSARQVRWAVALFFLAPWLHPVLLIPLAAGLVALVLLRREQGTDALRVRISRWGSELRYFALVPVAFLVHRFGEPFYDFAAGAVTRSGLMYDFFALPEARHTLPGFTILLWQRTLSLFAALAHVSSSVGSAIWAVEPTPGEVVCTRLILFFMLVGIVFPFQNRRLNREQLLLGVSLVLGVAATLLLGIFGGFPYGRPRYAMFLHGPIVLLASLGFLETLRLVRSALEAAARGRLSAPLRRRMRRAAAPAVILLSLLAVLWLGAGCLFDRYQECRRMRAAYDVMLSLIRNDRSDLALMFDFGNAPFVAVPEVRAKTEFLDVNAGPSARLRSRLQNPLFPVNQILAVTLGAYWTQLDSRETAPFRGLVRDDRFRPTLSYAVGNWYLMRLELRRPVAEQESPPR